MLRRQKWDAELLWGLRQARWQARRAEEARRAAGAATEATEARTDEILRLLAEASDFAKNQPKR